MKYFKYFQEYAGKGANHPSEIPQKNQTNNQPANKEKGTIEETSVGKYNRERDNGIMVWAISFVKSHSRRDSVSPMCTRKPC